MTYKTLETLIREMQAQRKPTEEELKQHRKRQLQQKQIIDNA